MAMSPEKIRAKALEPHRLAHGYYQFPRGFPTSVSHAAIREALQPLVDDGTLLFTAGHNGKIWDWAYSKEPEWDR